MNLWRRSSSAVAAVGGTVLVTRSQTARLLVEPSTPASDVGRQEAVDRLADFAARSVIVALFSYLAIRIGVNFAETGHLTGLLLLASETLVVVLTVLRRAAVSLDRGLRARVLTTLSMLGPPLVMPTTAGGLLPESVTVTVSAAGLLVVVAGKLSLGRAFGLMPANRGVVSTGMYRFVRHPIYVGYLLTHVAFAVANPVFWNLVILVSADLALLLRAVQEERTLARDSAYAAYCDRVRWRMVPGIF